MTGDAEQQQEQELSSRYHGRLRADVLKVGHHGSRTSTSRPFLRQVEPSFATISSGVRNRFGHPHAETLSALADHAILALRTDRVGSIIFATDGAKLDLYAFSNPR
jgi:competence protein ComEC